MPLVQKGRERPTGRLVASDVKRTFGGVEAAKSLSCRSVRCMDMTETLHFWEMRVCIDSLRIIICRML